MSSLSKLKVLSSNAKQRTYDRLGSRFWQYAARVRTLEVCDHVVDRKKFPRRASGPDFSIKEVRKCRGWLARIASARGLIRNRRHYTGSEPSFTYDTVYSLHSDVFHAWHAYARDIAPVFPNLVHLRWWGRCGDSSNPELFGSFIGHKLQKLTIGSCGPGGSEHDVVIVNSAEGLIKAAELVSSSFNFLAIEPNSISTSMLQTLMTQGFQQLQKFRCMTPISRDLWQFLTSLPRLHSLDVYIQPDVSALLEHAPLSLTASLSLHLLRVLGISALGAKRLLQSIQSPSIRSLQFMQPGIEYGYIQEHLSDLIQVIANHPSSLSLQELGLIYACSKQSVIRSQPLCLIIGLTVYPGKIHNATDIPLDVTPLLDLRNLEHIEMRDFLIDTSRTGLLDMLGAWHNLRVLRLKPLPNDRFISLDDFMGIMSRVSATRVEFIAGFNVTCSFSSALHLRTDLHYPLVRHIVFSVAKSDRRQPGTPAELASLVYYLMKAFPKNDFARHLAVHWQLNRLILAADAARRLGLVWSFHDYELCYANTQIAASFRADSYVYPGSPFPSWNEYSLFGW